VEELFAPELDREIVVYPIRSFHCITPKLWYIKYINKTENLHA
jgi:hypothetical protein